MVSIENNNQQPSDATTLHLFSSFVCIRQPPLLVLPANLWPYLRIHVPVWHIESDNLSSDIHRLFLALHKGCEALGQCNFVISETLAL